ncbi:hypothetical protein FDECE_6809 [Fusarium decemcellulare]|nr:hypothetical protein FDECE_6809 [Fusarium decemcellulare]
MPSDARAMGPQVPGGWGWAGWWSQATGALTARVLSVLCQTPGLYLWREALGAGRLGSKNAASTTLTFPTDSEFASIISIPDIPSRPQCRTISAEKNTSFPLPLSFLAPSFDLARARVTSQRAFIANLSRASNTVCLLVSESCPARATDVAHASSISPSSVHLRGALDRRLPRPTYLQAKPVPFSLMDNLWTRRTNSSSSGKLSLSTPGQGSSGDSFSRNASFSKRQGGDTPSSSKPNPFNTTTPGGGLVSPTSGASSAFGLGSGAFASFGSAKTPKSSANPFDSAMGSAVPKTGQSKDSSKALGKAPGMASISENNKTTSPAAPLSHPLIDAWTFWYRPPISKAHGFIEYEKTLHEIATVRTVEEFWEIFSYLKRPSTLPVVSDFHLFKKGVRPIWEDEVNKKGGKWVVRMKKGVADRYWEDLMLSLIGDQFGDAGDDVCGAVLSVRNGEDILSIWTRTDGGRVIKIRETMKHVLNFPPNTRVEFKSHDSSIQQRTAIEEQRREKAGQHHHHDKRHTGGVSKQPSEQS